MWEERKGAPRRQSVDSSLSRRERRRLLRLLCSAAILLAAVAVKLTVPDLMQCLSQQFSCLVSEQIDAQEVFAAMGRAIGGTQEDAWEEVYRAVFSPQQADAEGIAASIETQTDTEEETRALTMTQEMLGFSFRSPLPEGVITSSFGQRESPVSGAEECHVGIDLAAEEGTVIRAFADGTVRVVAQSSSLGNYLIVDHANGYATLYAHCSRITAASGAAVRCGDAIAAVGQSGNATGPHLHFVLYRGSTYLNPIYYL